MTETIGYAEGPYGVTEYGGIVVKTTAITVELEEKGKMTVTVLGAGGSSLSGASVAISGGTSESATTDSNGEVVFETIPVAEYTVDITHSDYISETATVSASDFA